MSVLFWVVTIAFILTALYQVLAKRDYFSIYTYILLGIYLPLLLYFAGWSEYITRAPGDGFYGVFIQFGLVLLFFLFAGGSGQVRYTCVRVRKARHGLIVSVTLVYLLACLLENYLGSGAMMPSVSGIDAHTYRAPFLSYFTKAVFAVCAINYLGARAASSRILKVIHWLLVFSIFAVYVVGKSARLEVAIVAVQLASLALLLNLSVVKGRINSLRPRHILALALAVLAASQAFVTVGHFRSTQFGEYQITSYAETIRYQGPDFLSDQLAWYYGYFPMSFDNLNLSILDAPPGLDLTGLSVHKAVYFGVLQLDNVLGLDPYNAESFSVSQIPQAVVTTGFWNIYFDYRELSFLVFLLAMLIYRHLRRRALSSGARLHDYVIYMYWVPTWLFMSFQPFPFDVFVFTDIALIYLLLRGLIVDADPESKRADSVRARDNPETAK